MTDDEQQIKQLVERWAHAVHAGNMHDVLAAHASDIVMFDVPPPHDGVRGIDAYRTTWPPFFEWQAQGAIFEIVELTITAGTEVAYAHALLRCGDKQELARHPETRLRLTLGLRKENTSWVVAHEHHSFADTSNDPAAAEPDIRAIHDGWFDGTAAKDIDKLMDHIADDIVSYEHDAPLQYAGINDVREVCQRGLDSAPGKITWNVPQMFLLLSQDLAVSYGLNRMTAELGTGETVESWSRGTRVFQRRSGEWAMVHQHVSYPYDPETGEAKTDLKPDSP